MNFSRIIKAAALVGVVSFAGQAFGSGTNPIDGDDFQSYNVAAFGPQVAPTVPTSDWTADATDASEIVEDYVTAFGTPPTCAYTNFVDGMTTRFLELNTEGKDLKFAAASTELYDVYVDTVLKVVGSDTAPDLSADTTIQTAVYLNTTDERLYGYSSAGWVKLDNVIVTNGQWICLQIKMDYTSGYFQNEPKAYVYVDTALAGPAYVCANASEGKLSVTEVAFRGTGMVDNFAVSQTQQTLAIADIITQSVDANGAVIGTPPLTDAPGYEYEIGGTDYSGGFRIDLAGNTPSYPQYELDRVELVGAGFTNVLNTWTVSGAFMSGTVPITSPIVAGGTYYVQGVYKVKEYTTTVVYSGDDAPENPAVATNAYGTTFTLTLDDSVVLDGSLAILDSYLEDSYTTNNLVGRVLTIPNVQASRTLTVTGNYAGSGPTYPVVITAGSLSWTSLEMGPPMTFSFAATGTVNAAGAMGVLVSETVNGAVNVISGNVAAAVQGGTAITGTVTVTTDISAYDTLFIRGFDYAD